jgi:hypothetical protein
MGLPPYPRKNRSNFKISKKGLISESVAHLVDCLWLWPYADDPLQLCMLNCGILAKFTISMFASLKRYFTLKLLEPAY